MEESRLYQKLIYKVYVAFFPLHIEGLDWSILSEIDESEAFQAVDSLKQSIVLVFLVLILLIVL